MTREELKEHCKKQIEMCEIWAISKGEDPHGKIYEEHKLILELLEQEPSRDMEEIKEVINCDADAETKCKMISNILTAKLHYFEEPFINKPCISSRVCEHDKQNVLEKIRVEIEKAVWEDVIVSLDGTDEVRIPLLDPDDVFEILDKYKAESETQESEKE